ncbi:MAG: M50 family metallopeptidase [Patescibacteria group bacterium]|nr:M50 family metallopeptidase [Patescibacteria group bacterium]MBU2508795.1 M50 family metallopeptidase [Patescibacteria group bacterium]
MAVIYFLIVLSVLVLIHEVGHFAAARLFGVKADEFGYGFPPRLLGFVKEKGKWKRVGRKDDGPYKNTIWSLNWLPLGGFVRIKGEQADGQDDPDSLNSKAIWKRMVILAAGVGMNWILAIVLFSTVFMIGTNVVLEDLPESARISERSVRITQIMAESPAYKVGLEPNDIVLSIDGVEPTSYKHGRDLIAERGEATFLVRIERDGVAQDIDVTPAYVKELDRVALGVGLAEVGHVSFPPLSAISVGVQITYGYTKAIVITFAEIFRDLATRQSVTQNIAGPVGIAVMTGQIAQQGIVPLLQFAAILSINLAVLNFLPIPALDGGRVVFLLVEKIRRRAMSRNLEAAIHNIAFLILIALILLVTARDIGRNADTIVGGLKGLVGM